MKLSGAGPEAGGSRDRCEGGRGLIAQKIEINKLNNHNSLHRPLIARNEIHCSLKFAAWIILWSLNLPQRNSSEL